MDTDKGSLISPGLILVLALVLLFAQPEASAALRYLKNPELAQQLRDLTQANKRLVRLQSLARSLRSNDVWLVELGTGVDQERLRRPALLLVAGIEGNDLMGSVSAVAWVQSLLENYPKDTAIRELLDSTTIYVFPRLNPDAAEFFFTKPKLETAVSVQPVDDDHDGLVDEDPPEDLDGDGLITSMRVQDPDGEYILDPVDPRLLLKTDRKKGEKGAWRLLSEGIDNDHDDAWNEDGVGGVNFNRNFPYNHKFFAPWAGRHQVSAVETRALADFAVAHANIGIVFTFGAADNLVQTPKGEAPKKPPVGIHEEDVGIYKELGKAWREVLGIKKELTGSSEPGTFSDWMYFHRGRLSLAARPWSPALQLELVKAKKEQDKPKDEKPAKDKSDETSKDKPKADKNDAASSEKKAEADTRNEEDRAFLKWLDENAPESFVAWKSYAHPDFSGKRVEIGGFAPFAKTNPPEKLLDDFAQKEGNFLTQLAGKLPRIALRKAEAKHLGKSIYELTIQVENNGWLPTALAQGSLTREVYSTRIVLNLESKAILSGTKTTMLGPIEGNGGWKEARYIINAGQQKQIDVEVVSMLGGTVRKSIELKATANDQ